MASLVGSRVERKEDGRFLQGKGRYTADINIANQTYAVFVRSPHARAKIKGVDTSKALKSSGVVGVLTGKEIAISFPVNTPTTPDDFNAFEVSTPLIFALACGDLTNTAYV